ncbi:MAG: flagellin [Opitutales bacterium]|nr:flagellin [Opitutales bacterium]
MSDISLNAGIRSNLLQLQQSSSLFQRTTDRLASGKEVNSAIDNPTNFFASVNLSDRAEGLSARLDGIGQAIQTVKAADNGISTIRSFVSAMKGVVNNAIGNSDEDQRTSLGRQFNELLVQVSSAARDSDYEGVNLLQGNQTNTVQFAETFDDSKLNILGFDVGGPGADGRAEVDNDGNIAAAAQTAVIEQAAVDSVAGQASAASAASQASVGSQTVSGFSQTANNQTVSFAGQTGFSVTGNAAAPTVALGTASAASQGSQASQASVASVAGQAAGTVTANVAMFLANQTGGTTVGIQGAGSGSGSIDWAASNYQTALAAITQQLESFDSELKIQAGNLSQNLSTITIREDFSNELINTLNEGADRLTLADLNEEGANLLALQTSTQLATQSLALSSQQSQGVLQLLG